MAATSPAERLKKPARWEKTVKVFLEATAIATVGAIAIATVGAIAFLSGLTDRISATINPEIPAPTRRVPTRPESRVLMNGENYTCEQVFELIRPNMFEDVMAAHPEIRKACNLPTGKVARPDGYQPPRDPRSP